MTWPTFAFAGAAIALWAWGGYWRDRAQRLAHERDVHRRMARRAQTAPPVPHDPRRGTLWGQPILNSLGETVAEVPSHRCDPPDMRRGESWTCPECRITWGAPVPGLTRGDLGLPLRDDQRPTEPDAAPAFDPRDAGL